MLNNRRNVVPHQSNRVVAVLAAGIGLLIPSPLFGQDRVQFSAVLPTLFGKDYFVLTPASSPESRTMPRISSRASDSCTRPAIQSAGRDVAGDVSGWLVVGRLHVYVQSVARHVQPQQ